MTHFTPASPISAKRRVLSLAAVMTAWCALHAACVDIDAPQVTFDVNHYEYKPVTFTATEDVDIVLPEGSWIQTAEVPSGTVSAGTKVKFYVAPDGPTVTPREAVITLNGKNSGSSSTVTVSQEPMTITKYGYPARWRYSIEDAHTSGWLTNGYAPANGRIDGSPAVITAVGVNNRRLGHIITTTYKQSTGLSNLYTGDYLLFSMPVRHLDAGTTVDFMLTFGGNDNTAPKHWIAEILDGGQWRKPAAEFKQIDGEDYAFYTKYFSNYQPGMYLQSFTLDNPVTDGLVQVRCRVVGNRNGDDGILSPDNVGAIYLPSWEFQLGNMTAYPGIPSTDTKKVAILGNSFTYFYGSPFMLKEIARSQGHTLDVRAFAKGSQYFHHFLELERACVVNSEPGYDFVILQDQSQQHSRLSRGNTGTIIEDTKALSAKFREGSPNALIMLENTWASPKDKWDGAKSSARGEKLLLNGAKAVAKADPNTDCVSPIGVAFHNAYTQGITDLWHTDDKHPSRNGSYLKSCVNYLMLYGEPFREGVSDCGCDPATAARLRAIAEQTVLGHQAEYTL